MIEEMKKEFLDRFAIHCSDIKGEWYGWIDIDTPLTVYAWIESKIEDAKRQAKIKECKYWQDAIFSPQSIIAQLSVIDFQLRITELSLPESPSPNLPFNLKTLLRS